MFGIEAAACALLLFCADLETERSGRPAITSTFFELSRSIGWSDAQWTGHFDAMEQAGMTAVIIQTTVDDGPAKECFFTWDDDRYTQVRVDGEPVDALLELLMRAEAYDLDVWIGLQLDQVGWYGDAGRGVPSRQTEADWLAAQARLSGEIAAAVLRTYERFSDRIVGWYFPGEDTPWSDWGDGTRRHHEFYLALSARLDAVDAALGIMLSPYYDPDAGRSSSDFETYLAGALRDTSVDVVALQTRALTAHRSEAIDDPEIRAAVVAEWTRAVESGVDAAGIGATTWANVELFESNWHPATVSDVVGTMRAAEPHVTAFTSWNFINHWSPWAFGVDWWTAPYLDYLRTGFVAPDVPPPPTEVSGAADGDELTITWRLAEGRVEYLEVLETIEFATVRVASPWWSDTSVSVRLHPGASYAIRSRSPSGDRSEAIAVPLSD